MDHIQFQRPDAFQPTEIPPTDLSASEATEAPVDLAQQIGRIETLLTQQNMWLERIAWMIRSERADRPIGRVKIEDINMPFWHMVGLIVKFNLANSPSVVIGALALFLIISLCGGATLLAAIGTLFRR